jgi:hypothetical protein
MVLWIEMKLDLPSWSDGQGVWVENNTISTNLDFVDGARCQSCIGRGSPRSTRDHTGIVRVYMPGVDERESHQDKEMYVLHC